MTIEICEHVSFDGLYVCTLHKNHLGGHSSGGMNPRFWHNNKDGIDATLAERGSRYGEFPDHAMISQGLKDVMRETPNWRKLPNHMREALEMIQHKIGRILNGDPTYKDSWTDIIGYATLVEKEL